MRSLLVLLVLTLPATAETVCVKYGPCPLDLSRFTCRDTSQSSFVRRVCYHAQKKFVAIKLNEIWYPYCEVPASAYDSLIRAPSVGTYYNENFRSKRDGTPGPFDCRIQPMPAFP
jgi:KTSC domain-containing protein